MKNHNFRRVHLEAGDEAMKEKNYEDAADYYGQALGHMAEKHQKLVLVNFQNKKQNGRFLFFAVLRRNTAKMMPYYVLIRQKRNTIVIR